MSRIPPLKRLAREDFPEQKSWIGKLLSPINEFFNLVSSALDESLTFDDNFNAQTKDISFIKTATYPSLDTPVSFASTVKGKPIGVLIINAVEDKDNPQPLVNAVTLSWTFAENTVKITGITGLTNDEKYAIKFLVIGA